MLMKKETSPANGGLVYTSLPSSFKPAHVIGTVVVITEGVAVPALTGSVGEADKIGVDMAGRATSMEQAEIQRANTIKS